MPVELAVLRALWIAGLSSQTPFAEALTLQREKETSSLTPRFPSFPFLSLQLKENEPGLLGIFFFFFLFHYEWSCIDGVTDSKSGFRCLGLDQCHLEGEKFKKKGGLSRVLLVDPHIPLCLASPSMPLLLLCVRMSVQCCFSFLLEQTCCSEGRLL